MTRPAVAHGRRWAATAKSRAAALVDPHRHRGPVDLALRILERDRVAAGSVVGSAIAFRLFLFVVPLLLFVVGLSGVFATLFDRPDLDDAGIGGALATQIDTALSQPTSTRWIALLTGLFGMASAGRTLTKAMTQASCLGWQLPLRAKASVRVVGTMIGLLVGIGVVAAAVNALRHHLGLGAAGASFVGVLACYTVAWFLISTLLPRPTSDPGVLLPGACLIGVTLTAMQAVSQLYLPRKFSNASQLYGAIGVTVVTLGWFFIAGRAIVLSIAVGAAIYERYGSSSRVLFALPVLRRLPSAWPWLRRTFQLDDSSGANE